MTDSLSASLDALERDASLLEPRRLRERTDALDRLEARLFALPDEDTALRARIEALSAALESVNNSLYQDLCERIRRGIGADGLRQWAATADAASPDEGYDHLDALLAGVLRLEEPAAPAALAAEMVFYQPTPARHIFESIGRADLGEDDVLLDLGSGLGHVVLAAAILSPARCVGIEQDSAYVDSANRCAEALGLRNAAFVAGDVREADLSQGTVFYLYTPFTGTMLRRVLERLRQEAGRRVIRIATLGPCTAVVAQESWLRADGAVQVKRPALFRSAPGAV